MTNLNYKHLHYFWVVANKGGVARASESLHLTPQTISGQLRLLEEAVGAKLFSRVGRRLVLTEAGRLALGYADEIFNLGTELKEVLQSRPSGRPLRLVVGIADVVPKLIAYRLLEPALQLAEPVRIVCQEDKLDNLLADIALHKLDVVLADGPMPPGIHVRVFNHFLGECGITFFATGRRATRYRRHFPQSLENAPMLLPSGNSALRGVLRQWFEQVQVQPHIVGEFDDSALMKAFGQAGAGVFCAPSVIEREIARQYQVKFVGRTRKVRQQFYAISAERRLQHPAVVAVSHAARRKIFATGRHSRS
jgi:LysR family transcriptional activator of nhaA